MVKRKWANSLSCILLIPVTLWAGSEQHGNFRLTRDHSNVVIGIKGNVCEDFLDILNRIPEEKLQPCHTPDFSDSPFTLVPFTPLDSKRQLGYGKRIYHRNNAIKAYRDAWAETEKEYETGYRRLSEAYLDLDGDGVKEHVIKEIAPSKNCIPSKVGNVLITQEQWDEMSKGERYKASQKYSFDRHYYAFYSDEKRAHMTFIESIVSYEGVYFSSWTKYLNLKNNANSRSNREWVTLAQILKSTNKNEFTGDTICKYWLNEINK